MADLTPDDLALLTKEERTVLALPDDGITRGELQLFVSALLAARRALRTARIRGANYRCGKHRQLLEGLDTALGRGGER